MRSPNRLILFFGLLSLALSACTATTSQQATPPPPALPTAKVPPVSEIDAAWQRWKDSGNRNYFFEVEERTPSMDRKLSLVVVDGQVRAAQVQNLQAGAFSEAAALPLAEAQGYTVDALFDRLRKDALGQGGSAVNLQVLFDKATGAPSLAIAEAILSYAPDGSAQLDRAYSYNLVTRLQALIEDTNSVGKEPLLVLTRSNGPQAWCDSLRIFTDGSSLYSDDCRQTALPLTVPGHLMEKLRAELSAFASLEDVRQQGDQIERLVIQGGGTGPAAPETAQRVWTLTDQLHELLSYPLGAGVTLMYIQNNTVLGMDMVRQIVQPAKLNLSGMLHGLAISPDQKWLAYSDDQGVRAINIGENQDRRLLPAPEGGGYYQVRGWSQQNRLLVSQVPADGQGDYRLGWISFTEPQWHDLPLPEGLASYGCDGGAAWSAQGDRVAVSGQEYGAACNLSAGLTVVDLETQTAGRIVARSINSGEQGAPALTASVRNPAWSADGEWIAFSMDEDAAALQEFPSRLYVVHPDGRSLAPVSANSRGRAEHAVWSPKGLLYYAVSGETAELNGIYRYDVSSGENVLFLAGDDLRPLSISPDGQFLAYTRGAEIYIWAFLREENLPNAILPQDGLPAQVMGWMVPPES
jgi:hypothetical protein